MQAHLEFLGAAGNVTGSRHLLQVDDTRILVDCGLYQERALQDRNWERFRIDPRSIDAMLLTHAHLDHCGLLPKLVKEGFRGRVHCTGATASLTRIVMLDSAKIQEEDVKWKEKRHRKQNRKSPHPYVPLYTIDDTERACELLEPCFYEEDVEVAPGITATFHDAGHVLGSSTIKVRIQRDGETRTVVFSGDLGRWDRPILEDPATYDQADCMVMESTYGDRNHPETENPSERLEEVINSTIQRGGNIVIPAFSIERSQELMYYLSGLRIQKKIPRIMTFLDSPMAIRVTEVFKDNPAYFDEEMLDRIHQGRSPFDYLGLKMSRTTAESKAINQIKGSVIVMAGSGMCTGGRIKHHISANIERPESTILFVGYQAVGTLGRIIVDGAKEIRLFGEQRPIRAQIEQIHGFSGHAGQRGLLRWATALKQPPQEVFIVHGEPEASRTLQEKLAAQTGWKVSCPQYGESATLE
ncbi:MBL fold metallo-hydrolase [Candidatus Sumerlaeota bacterium]|nr:MBL fold metallo-hydrolase [Candidatus Sumerlaeota bacterium]